MKEGVCLTCVHCPFEWFFLCTVQILACGAALTFVVCEGMALSYSSALIPALRHQDSDIPISENQGVLLGVYSIVSNRYPVSFFY